MTPDLTPPLVTILMGVLDGATYLPAQLASIAGQSHANWHLVCSDDGSTDASLALLARFARDHPGRVSLRDGPARGFSANYMQMLRALDVRPGHVALADQDDIWLPDKIACALDLLAGAGDTPTLYCGRRLSFHATQRRMYASALPRHPPGLRNALAENIASGNTIVMNPAMAALARQAALRTGAVFAHDWWLYLLATACGGRVIFDSGPPKVLYRQHGGNAIGAGRSLRQQLRRKIGVLRGEFRDRVGGNLAALAAIADLLEPEALEAVLSFALARQRSGVGRMLALRRLGLYRQGLGGTLGFWGAASLGRV